MRAASRWGLKGVALGAAIGVASEVLREPMSVWWGVGAPNAIAGLTGSAFAGAVMFGLIGYALGLRQRDST